MGARVLWVFWVNGRKKKGTLEGKLGICLIYFEMFDRVVGWFDHRVKREPGQGLLVVGLFFFGLSWADGLITFGPGFWVLFLDFWC